MKVLIIDGGSYQDTMLDVDFLPRAGETVNLGAWDGIVARVIHLPADYRKGQKREHGTELVLSGTRRITPTRVVRKAAVIRRPHSPEEMDAIVAEEYSE
jgi:hypothetical protein